MNWVEKYNIKTPVFTNYNPTYKTLNASELPKYSKALKTYQVLV